MATKQSVGDLIDDIQLDLEDNEERKIPDIITFVEGREWLGLPFHPSNPINLFTMQKIMLKAYYRGTIGNENLELTDLEMQMLEDLGLNDDSHGNVLEKYHTNELFRELILVWGRRCLSEDMTIINPEDGSINKIGDLYDKKIRIINSWTYDEEKNKMTEVEDTDIIFQGERDCYELTTNSGHKIECTENHPFLTQRGWVKLEDLDVKTDKVSIVEKIPFFGKSKKINKDEAAILGYMTADGNCSQDSTFFTCGNKKILDDFINRLNNISDNLKIFNDPWTKAKSKKNQYKITSKKYESESFFSKKENRNRSRRQKNDLMKLLIKWNLAGKTCHYKTVPLELFKCPKDVIIEYLRALFSCDGNLGTRDTATCEFTTVCEQQAILIQSLLSKFGIIAYLRKKRVISKIIDEKKVLREYDTFCYIVYFSRKKYVERFLNEIGFLGKDKYIQKAIKKLVKIDSNIKTTHKDNHPFSFYKIKNIDFIGKKRTFDLSVSDDKNKQNFVANSFIIHNSGKDFVVSVIALYEAMKLLECKGGDPYAMYELSSANTINILTVANSKAQANIAFSEIREKLFHSDYFRDKYGKDGIGAGSIYLLTPKDKIENKKFKEKGLPQKKGSIGIIVGHSNSDSLLGMGCIVLILDEVASYKTTGGSSSGDRIYAALTPTVQTYVRKTYARDEKGKFVHNEHGQKEIIKRIYDGKVISISSPRAQEGKFYELFNTAKDVPSRLAMRVATWNINPHHTRESLRADNNTMSETEFNMEFGAEFSGTGLESFFTEEQIKPCFIGHNLRNVEMGAMGKTYFVHLDPATSSHNYALVVLHRENFLNPQTKKADFRIVVDHIKHWEPVSGPINPNEVMQYVIDLKRKFHIGLITYDAFASQESILKMRKAGIPNKETKFTGAYKFKIYKELENLVNSGRIFIPYHHLLYNEMIELQRKFTPTGFKILPKKDGDGVKSDDVCVIPETVVYTNKGAEFIKDVIIGDNILTHDGSYQEINGFSDHLPNSGLIKLQPYYGLPVISTRNHIVEVYSKNNKIIWKRCDELTIEDKLVRSFCDKKKKFVINLLKYAHTDNSKYCNVKYLKDGLIRSKNANGKWHYNKISSTPDFGYICGLYLSEGSLGHHGISFAFHIDEVKIHKKLNKCIKNTFNISSTAPYQRKNNKGCQINVNSQIIKSLFKDLFEGRISINKRIPLLIMQSPLKFQKELIKGLFDGDGCVCEKRLIYTTASRLLANQVQQLLLRFKIVSSISSSKRKGKVVLFKDRKSKYNADLYNIMITDAISFNRLSKILEINKIKRQSKYHSPKYYFKKSKLIVNIYKIEDIIEDANIEKVINISVSNNNSYVSESLNSHNCDCLAGATYIAIEKQTSQLPRAKLANLGNPSGNQIAWRNMQGGVYGVGAGQQVAKSMESRSRLYRDINRYGKRYRR